MVAFNDDSKPSQAAVDAFFSALINWTIRQQYEAPAIIHEIDLETRAGSPICTNPLELGRPCDDDNPF